MQHLILSLLAKKLIFLENHKRGIKNGVASIGRSSRRASQAPLHLRIDSGRTTPARPSARAPGSRAAPIASAPAAHASGNRGSHQSSATRAAQQVPTASSSSAPQNRTRSPVSSARPLCPSHGPSRAAASHLHSELRHALHTAHTRPPETSTAPAPPLPTRCTLPQHSTRAYGV